MVKSFSYSLLLVMLLSMTSHASAQDRELPRAAIVPHLMEKHGNTRIDNYYWLNDRENPDVIAYLEAENSYFDEVMAPLENLRESLYNEMRARIREEDQSVPYRLDSYFYYSRFEEGAEYPIYARKAGSLDGDEEVILDVNSLVEGDGFLQVMSVRPGPEHRFLAFAADDVGRRKYTIRFKDLSTGEFLDDEIEDVTGNYAWAGDGEHIFYTRQDPETLLWNQIFRHRMGTAATQDVLVYEEPDSTFSTFVFKTKSRDYIIIGSTQTLSAEYRFLDANDPTGDFSVIMARERDHEYSVDHFGDHFFLRTNDSAQNFRLIKLPVGSSSRSDWQEVIPHREDVLLEDIDVFRDHLVLSERSGGLTNLRVIRWDGTDDHYLDFGEPVYTAWVGQNPEFGTSTLRYGFTSLTTPASVYDYQMNDRSRELMKQTPVLGGFEASNYRSERVYATASDGERIPVSLVYRQGTALNGDSPLLLYGYGSYGYSMDPTFSSSRLSLLDRGFVYAIAHIRGGQEMGRRWYEDGKLFKKMNTFTDFIAVADHLVEAGYTDAARLYAMGGSAGGLLMGAVINMRPDLFDGVVAAVPFVDVTTTMLDESIPLTTSEYDEWGNPNDSAYYEYIMTYSPYDNVVAADYPNLLVTTGLHDSQVQYWEPAKWVAKLRAIKTGNNLLLMHTNMEAGHGGMSGRFRRLREAARDYSFLLNLAGLAGVPTP